MSSTTPGPLESIMSELENLGKRIEETHSVIFFIKAVQENDISLPPHLFDTDLFLSIVANSAGKLIEETKTSHRNLADLHKLHANHQTFTILNGKD
jgi:hypothetical protein